MEKSQYELCLEILRRLGNIGILDEFILIGSWCIPFYQDYFSGSHYIGLSAIKTRDIDFLVNQPSKVRSKVDIHDIIKDLGFTINFKGREGYIILDHPLLAIEFLVPEKGRGSSKPYPLPQLGINAQPVRMVEFLAKNTIKAKVENFFVTLPHPANFALHKVLVSQRRQKGEKALKDRDTSIRILKALIEKGERQEIKRVFDSMPRGWQQKIIKGLKEPEEEEIVEILKV